MNVKGLHVIALIVALMMAGETSGQDPDMQDSLIIGNLNGSIIPVTLNQEIILPVWIKTDDSVTFFHTPLASDNDHISLRNGGNLYTPLSLWDEVAFQNPNINSPSPGFTSQSILGFAYLMDPRDPQNFLYTNYQWWHVADFSMVTTSDSSVLGDTVCLIEGSNPTYGGLRWGLPDGVIQVIPAAKYPCLHFTENIPPVFTEPDPGTVFNINNEFPVQFAITVTDEDNDLINLSYVFQPGNARLDTVNIVPGSSSYLFRWNPSYTNIGQFIATFTANDNHGGLTQLDVAFNVTPVLLEAGEVEGYPCEEVSVPVNIVNIGETSIIGGFDIFLQYGIPEMIQLLSVERGPRIQDWEYFSSNIGDSSSIRLVGIGDVTGAGPHLPPGEGPVAYLNFQIALDTIYVGSYAEINFISGDENDNTVSDSTGYLLIHPQLDSGWVYNIDPNSVLIGDINLNGVPWEISDAVLLANHIIMPLHFPFNYTQLLASDTNQDGVQASITDLVYLMNIINGTVIPPRLNSNIDISASVYAVSDPDRPGVLKYEYDSPIPAGGILIRLEHGEDPVGIPIAENGLNPMYSDDNGILAVLLFGYDGELIYPGQVVFELEVTDEKIPVVTDLQISDLFGNFIPVAARPTSNIPGSFALQGAYPNPFNSSTTIRFSLHSSSDVELSVFNVLGQAVKHIRFGDMAAGENSIEWDGTDDSGGGVSSGVYLYRITAGDLQMSSRMTLLK